MPKGSATGYLVATYREYEVLKTLDASQIITIPALAAHNAPCCPRRRWVSARRQCALLPVVTVAGGALLAATAPLEYRNARRSALITYRFYYSSSRYVAFRTTVLLVLSTVSDRGRNATNYPVVLVRYSSVGARSRRASASQRTACSVALCDAASYPVQLRVAPGKPSSLGAAGESLGQTFFIGAFTK
eukprot:807338-Pleurochrysis_carterae.AAC.6